MDQPGTSAYTDMGGSPFFQTLVHHFYAGVSNDPLLTAMYPEDDLAPAERRLLMFLEQYWGGPTTYGDERGHPRLRMRHAPFAIDAAARDRWLESMRAALDAAIAEHGLAPALEQELWAYLVNAAHAMLNTESPEPPRQGITMSEKPR